MPAVLRVPFPAPRWHCSATPLPPRWWDPSGEQPYAETQWGTVPALLRPGRAPGAALVQARRVRPCRGGDECGAQLHGAVNERSLRIGRLVVPVLVVRIARRFSDVRVMGLAAEMTYYALLSLFPLTGAVGASLGFLERLVGSEEAERAEAAILTALDVIFSREVTADVIAPLVQGLLQEERGGFALGGFAVSLFFASRIFRSAIEALDSTYGVEERRGMLAVWTLGLAFALCAVLMSATLVSMVVIGPLLGGGHAIAARLGLGSAFALAWTLLRWPVVFIIATGFLALLYRFGPNVRNTWRETLPGAIFGMVALLIVAGGFRIYIERTGLQSPRITEASDAVAVALQVIGAMMAALLWFWLSSMVVLTGGVVNAEVSRMDHGLPPPRA
jgi:membrane protein